MSREAWGDPPDQKPQFCPNCGNTRHTPGCEVCALDERRIAAEGNIARLTAELEACAADRDRLDFIEKRSRQSSTGVSFDWAPRSEDDVAGWRMMWRHVLCARKKTLREAIDEAMARS